MAADLISEIIDQAAIDKQISGINTQLDTLAKRLKEFPTLGGDTSNIKNLIAENKAYEASIKALSNTQKQVLDSEKLAAIERKRIADERTQQARLEKADLLLQQIEIKKKAIAEKEAAIASKTASAEAVAAGRERILQLKAEQDALEKAAEAERNRNNAEQQALSGTFNPGSGAIPSAPKAAAIPLTVDQGNIVLIKTYEAEIARLTKTQALAKAEFQAGKITQGEYARTIATSTQSINTLKKGVSDLNTEQKLQQAVSTSERNSLQRAQALIAQYTNEKKKLNLATADGKLLNDNYNKAIEKSNAFILKNADAETARTKNIGNYGTAINKILGPIRTLANILPGIGLSGIFLLGFEAVKALVEELGLFNSKLSDTARQRELLLQVQKESLTNYGKEAGELKVLRATIESTSVPMATRLQAIKDLKAQYPDYFKGLSNEQLLTGKVADAYDLATKAILRKAQAQAATSQIEANSAKELKILQDDVRDSEDTNARLKEKPRSTTVDEFGNVVETQKQTNKLLLDGFNVRQKARVEERDQIKKDNDFLLKFAVDGAKETVKIEKTKADQIRSSTKSTLDSDFELYKIAQERKIKLLDEGTKDESKTFDERIAILQDASNARLELIDREKQEEIRKNDEKEAALLTNIKKAKGTELNNLKIELQNNETGRAVIEAKFFDKRLEVFGTHEKQYLDIQKSANDQEEKLRKENYDQALKDAEANNTDVQAKLARQFERRAANLNDRFTQGIIDQKEFNLEREKLEFDYQEQSIRNEIAYAKQILEIQKAAGVDTVKQEEAVQKLVANLEGIFTKRAVSDQEDKLKKDKEFADKKKDLYKQLYSEIQQTIFQFLDDGLKREEQDLDERKRLLDEDTTHKLANIDQLGLSEVERTKKKAEIEKQAQFESEQIEKRKRAIEVQRAKYEKAASIASIISSTAQAVVGALAQAKTLGVAALPLAALVGAIGALQLARAISTPLPKYFKGTDSAKAGPAIFGEIGRELVIPKDGQPYLSPAVATFTNLVGGEKIIPADMTANILNAVGIGRLAGMDPRKPVTSDSLNSHILGKMYGEIKDMNRKGRIIIQNTSDIKTKAWYQYHFKN